MYRFEISIASWIVSERRRMPEPDLRPRVETLAFAFLIYLKYSFILS